MTDDVRDSDLSPASHRHSLWRKGIIALVCGALAVSAIAIYVAGRDGGEPNAGASSNPATSSNTPDPESPAEGDEPDGSESDSTAPDDGSDVGAEVTEDAAVSLVSRFVDLSAQTTEPAGSAALGEVAGPDLVAAIEADYLELEANGWSRSGVPTVVWSRPAQTEPASSTVGARTFEVCLDSSDVVLTASDGGEVVASPTTRAVNIFTVAPVDGEVRLVSRSFPDDPSC